VIDAFSKYDPAEQMARAIAKASAASGQAVLWRALRDAIQAAENFLNCGDRKQFMRDLLPCRQILAESQIVSPAPGAPEAPMTPAEVIDKLAQGIVAKMPAPRESEQQWYWARAVATEIYGEAESSALRRAADGLKTHADTFTFPPPGVIWIAADHMAKTAQQTYREASVRVRALIPSSPSAESD